MALQKSYVNGPNTSYQDASGDAHIEENVLHFKGLSIIPYK